MNRFKFRVWDKKSKLMINNIVLDPRPIICYKHDDFLQLIADDENYTKILKRNNYDPEDWIFQQFTGLLDKNGKEIYEGDIVKTSYTIYPIQSVEFSGGMFKLSNLCLDDTPLYYDADSCEIIGNIFENPGLLEKNEKK